MCQADYFLSTIFDFEDNPLLFYKVISIGKWLVSGMGR